MFASSLSWVAGLAGLAALLGLCRWLWVRRRETVRGRAIGLLSATIERSHLAVMITDLESRIRYVNAGARRQTGYAEDELLGHAWHEFRQPETADEVLAELVTTVRGGKSWSGEWVGRRKSGEPYQVRGFVVPLKAAQGEISHFAAVFEDAAGRPPGGGAGLALANLPALEGPALTAAFRQCLERRGGTGP